MGKMTLGRQPFPVYWKWGAALAILGITMYPIALYPMYDSQYYKDIQKVTRKGINQEEIQPVGLKVWSDPFDRK